MLSGGLDAIKRSPPTVRSQRGEDDGNRQADTASLLERVGLGGGFSVRDHHRRTRHQNEGRGQRAQVPLGHIGVGGQGSYLFSQFQKLKGAQSVACADAYKENRDRRAGQCGGKAYADFRELLARQDIDAVVVATPDHWHVPIAIMAARAGKDCYVEKPLGICTEQDLLCRKVFQEHNRVFQYGTRQRAAPLPDRLGWCATARSAPSRLSRLSHRTAGAGGSTQEAPVPPGFDYEMWLGPAPAKLYTVDRCHPPGNVLDLRSINRLLGGWGAHPLDILVWGCDADQIGPWSVEGDRQGPRHGAVLTRFTTGT